MGRRRQPDELIEIFDPARDEMPGELSVPPPVEPSIARSRMRPGVALAVVLVVMLVGAGTVALLTAGGEEADRPSASPSSTAPSTTRPRLAPVDPALADRQFIDDPAAVGLTIYSADVLSPTATGHEFRLWATGNGRRWMLVESGPGRRSDAVVGGVRREVAATGADPVEVADLPRGDVGGEQIRVASLQNGGRWALLHTFGFRESDLAAVVSALDPAVGPDSVSRPAVSAGAGRVTLQGTSLLDGLFGVGRTATRYLTPSGGQVVLRIGEGALADGAGGRATLSTDLVGGDITSGRLVPTGQHYVTWEYEGRIATLLSTAVRADVLRTMVGQVRVADDQQWRALLYGPRPDYRIGDFAVSGQGVVAASGEPWRAGVQAATRAGRPEYLWWWDVPGDPSRSVSIPAPQELALASTATAFDVVVVPGATFVFVAAPDSSAPRVTRVVDGDGVVHELTFTRPFADAPFTVAVVRTDAFGPVVAGDTQPVSE